MIKLPYIKTKSTGVFTLVHFNNIQVTMPGVVDNTFAESDLVQKFIEFVNNTESMFIPIPDQCTEQWRMDRYNQDGDIDIEVGFVRIPTAVQIRIMLSNQLSKSRVKRTDIIQRVVNSEYGVTYGEIGVFFDVREPLDLNVLDVICSLFSIELSTVMSGGPLKAHVDSVDKVFSEAIDSIEYERQAWHVKGMKQPDDYYAELGDGMIDDVDLAIEDAFKQPCVDHEDIFNQDKGDLL